MLEHAGEPKRESSFPAHSYLSQKRIDIHKCLFPFKILPIMCFMRTQKQSSLLLPFWEDFKKMRLSSLPTRVHEGRDTSPSGKCKQYHFVVKNTVWLFSLIFTSARLMQSSVSHLYWSTVHIIPKHSPRQLFLALEVMFKWAPMTRLSPTQAVLFCEKISICF